MLQNTGPYGPNETPMSMGGAVNMSQMSTNPNFTQNLNNVGKIAHQTAEQPSPQYPLPDYSIYNHSSLNLSPQINSFPSYHPHSSHSTYMPSNSASFHDTSWQNGLFPMNLNAQATHGPNMLNYPPTYEKRVPNSTPTHNYLDHHFHGKSLPINIPQVPTKAFQKFHSDEYEMFNIEKEKYNLYHRNLIEDTSDFIQERAPDRPLLDTTKRRSLENTVRLIEDILTNTTRNKELEQPTDFKHQEKDVTYEPKHNIDEQDHHHHHSFIHQQKDIQRETITKDNNEIKNTYHNIKKTNLYETITSKITRNDENTEQEQETEINYQSNENYRKQKVSKQNIIEQDKGISQQDQLEETDDELNDKNKENDPLAVTQGVDVKSESNSPERETEEPEAIDIKPILNTVFVKLDVEGEPYVDVKVENIYWTDTDFANPFHRDANGIQRDDVSNENIVESHVSIMEATEAIKKDPKPKIYYECPNCTLIFNHPKRFLIHTKWHSFGLINERRTIFAKEREIWRNQRREARVVNRMNSREVKTEMATGKNVFPCKECDKAFTSKGSLKNHKQRYHPTRLRECKICGITVVGWMALRNHVASHGDHSFTCAECHKVFKHAHSLAKHRDTHLEKTVTCENCPKKFGTVAQLKMHQKVHERAQRGATYQCSYCAKSFYEAYNLAVHERTHRNERPFVCDICNTSYGTNSSLKRHLKVSHSTAKPYQCTVCRRNFVSERIRDRHTARVHAEPDDFRFKCTICECKYLKLKDLQKHVYKMHPKNKRRRKQKKEADEPSGSWDPSQTD